MNYDIIGDIHGHADELQTLLTHMGYQSRGGAWRHPSRQAIFVGDYIDRGPKQLEAADTVRRMVDAGSALAIMGNHEFNAIAWHTEDPDHPGEFLRCRSGALGEKNLQQHQAFVAAVENKPDLHREVIDWFLELPLWLELPGLRVVHACWQDDYMDRLRPLLGKNQTLNRELMVQASREGAMEFETVEGLTKGLEARLPQGRTFKDKDGHERRNVRIRWWDGAASSYRDLALMEADERQSLPDLAVTPDSRSAPRHDTPVFFGHYWMKGQPAPQSPMAACVDYSVAKGGRLVAYRWDGEAELNAKKFTWVGNDNAAGGK